MKKNIKLNKKKDIIIQKIDKKSKYDTNKKNGKKEKKNHSNPFIKLFAAQSKMFSLFRFNIGFKLTLEITVLFISLMIILNLVLFYVGSSFFYFQAKDDLKVFTKYAEETYTLTKNVNSINTLLEDKNIDFYIYDSKYNLIYSNNQVGVKYSEESTKFNVFKLNFPSVINYRDAFYIDENNYLVLSKILTMPYKKNIYGMLIISSILSFILLIVVISSSNKITKSHLYPIKVMTDKVKSISSNNLSTRLDVSGTKDELKDLAEEFNKMINEIEYSYEQQKVFVSDASHELRTPIAVVKGYANLLNRWGKDDEKILDESVDAIIEETDNMQTLVENLLFIARNDKNALKIEKDYFSLQGLVCDIYKETKMIDNDHVFSCVNDFVGEYYGSHDSLKQAIRIFMDNSIKYTQSGGYIKVKLKESAKDIFLTIEDNGIGMAKEDIEKVFDRFYRADKSRAKIKENSSGNGLGLAIAKIIIAKHDGLIHVESELNIGTKITIILPKNK
ncbi:sensor histidine kinase [Helicovermis profundi]|uniref:histidine kinase n=1 Tax=Helicovermis profundi TaxID=3065157 RepID=A0AAU9EE27_9FIRM|nr:hypothetical protein HLPR_12530 [Clostridia bacterium S502]